MRVIKEFKCLRSGRLFLPGADYPEDDPARVNELAEKGFLAARMPERRAPDAGADKAGPAHKK